jgi:hypothetical protein
MRIKSRTPAPAENGHQGKTKQQASKTYTKHNTTIENGSQYAVHWVALNYHLPMPVAEVVADLSGLGGAR